LEKEGGRGGCCHREKKKILAFPMQKRTSLFISATETKGCIREGERKVEIIRRNTCCAETIHGKGEGKEASRRLERVGIFRRERLYPWLIFRYPLCE